MNTILSVLAAILVAYLLFVALNTHLYAEKQGESLFGGSVELQWGF